MKNQKKFLWLGTFIVFIFAIEIFSYLILTLTPIGEKDPSYLLYKGVVASKEGDSLYKSLHPHPYFGYSEKHNKNFAINDLYTLEKKENDYNVAILGGSVAVQVGLYIEKELSEFKSTLIKNNPELKDKNIRFFNLAISGSKQPQQFTVAAHFIEKLDLVFNLEGFNESMRPMVKNIPLEYPHLSHLHYRETDKYKNLYETRSLLIMTSRYLSLVFNNLDFSYSANLFSTLMAISMERLETKWDFELINTLGARFIDDEFQFEDRIKIWEKYTRMQDLITKHHKVKSYYFLQPNISLKRKNLLTPEEADLYKEQPEVSAWYPHAIELYQRLKTDKIKTYDLTPLFSDIKETVYSDSCCHYNALGVSLLTKEILSKISSH